MSRAKCQGQNVKGKMSRAGGIRIECVQTDNGFEFTNRFSNFLRSSAAPNHATSPPLQPWV